ncbi:hypothetical protein OHT52_20990 [Streptomyces sp. NBC_00247]|nr:hypothetical protein [Streptomyces sp. NBC_00247]
MTTTEKPLTAGDCAYRALIMHTERCARCRNNAACDDAAALARVWKAARR